MGNITDPNDPNQSRENRIAIIVTLVVIGIMIAIATFIWN